MTDSVYKNATHMRIDSTGTHYWVKGKPATKKEWERATWWPGNPICDQLLEEWGLCRNCYCSDCGCCVGCGGVNADFESGHGYACVM